MTTKEKDIRRKVVAFMDNLWPGAAQQAVLACGHSRSGVDGKQRPLKLGAKVVCAPCSEGEPAIPLSTGDTP